MKKKHKKIRREVLETNQDFLGYQHRRHHTGKEKTDVNKKKKEYDILIKESNKIIKEIIL